MAMRAGGTVDKMPDAFNCPCGRLDAKKQALAYARCCGQYLEGKLAAPDAQSLMRSRYSAFVLGLDDYLLQTWHASTRPGHIQRQQESGSTGKRCPCSER